MITSKHKHLNPENIHCTLETLRLVPRECTLYPGNKNTRTPGMNIIPLKHKHLKPGSMHCALERGHGGVVVTHSPPISEVSSSNPGPYVGKLVIAY